MKGKVALIAIMTDDVPVMVRFYRDALGFEVEQDVGDYVEFVHEGVRFAICARSVMQEVTGHESYQAEARGQTFELSFRCESPDALDDIFAEIVALGGEQVQRPTTMSWGQRTAFFADPEGNIHELYADVAANDGEDEASSSST